MLPQPPPLQGPPAEEPKRIRVFGILHIVFGALGLLYTLLSVVTLIGLPFVLEWAAEMIREEAGSAAGAASGSSPPGAVQAAEEVTLVFDAMRTLFAELAVASWVQVVTSFIVSILILIAGIALVKKRQDSVSKSNRYVWCSIGAKVINLILFFAIGMEANRKYQETIKDLGGMPTGASGPAGLDVDQLQSILTSGGTIVGMALTLVYPILAYVMLNKPEVKSFLNRGSGLST